jgi:ADP-heptose:LPS heptosyltransferase
MGEVIGDGLIKLPFVAGLRAAFPDAHVAWAAAKGQTVYTGSLKPAVAGLIDEIVTRTPTGAAPMDWLPWLRPFGGARFDLVIDTQENRRRRAVARRAVVPGGRFVSLADATGPRPDAVTDRLAVLLDLAAPGARPASAALADPALCAEALRLLPGGPAYIGFAPGAGGADKRWPLENFVAMARAQTDAGRTAVFFLGPQEAAERTLIADAVPEALFPEDAAVRGLAGPALVVALAGRLTAAVANDAGPGHMLAAGGAPLLSLQKDGRRAAKFKPAALRLEMLVADRYGGGMADLPLADALAALDRLLERED